MSKTTKEKPKSKKALIIVLAILAFCFFAVLGSSDDKKEVLENMSAVEKMEIAFEGDYNQREIKEKISKAMNLYGTPLTEDNYSRAGSVLVTLRKSNGIDEMIILNKMIEMYSPDVIMSFSEMSAWAVVSLSEGIY